jgi:hypothetical protein
MNEIPPIPEVPLEIFEAVKRDKLAIFMGAGVSRLVGCLGWDELANKLVDRCFKELKNGSNQKLITFKEKETLLSLGNQRKIITICHKLLVKESKEQVFYEEMEKALRYKQIVEEPNIYSDLAKISALFITTNADEHFDSKFQTNIKYLEEDFLSANINKDTLFHIHGSILFNTSLIFTLSQYYHRYNTPSFQGFLNSIFSQYTILFVGYGLSEFELLEYLFNKNSNTQKTEIKHFLLSPYFTDEENILNMEQYYYNDMNIEVIPYCKNELGYEQLNKVISIWVDEILAKTTMISDRLNEIDEAFK